MNRLRTQHADAGTVSEIITQLATDYELEQTAREAAEKNAAEKQQQNESLQKANLTLLVKFGVTAAKGTDAGRMSEDDEPELSFDALFDKDGNLK